MRIDSLTLADDCILTHCDVYSLASLLLPQLALPSSSSTSLQLEPTSILKSVSPFQLAAKLANGLPSSHLKSVPSRTSVSTSATSYASATMSANQSHHNEASTRQSSDASSMMTTSSTSTTAQLLKSKFVPGSQPSSQASAEKSPREKQLERQAGRPSWQLQASIAAMK